jgi:hypothetical protein
MLLDCDGRPLRRAIGFTRSYIAERRAAPAEKFELVDCVGSSSIDCEDEHEDEETLDARRALRRYWRHG